MGIWKAAEEGVLITDKQSKLKSPSQVWDSVTERENNADVKFFCFKFVEESLIIQMSEKTTQISFSLQ